mmetsp:Transcript_4896/g.10134  ORF Transcript_4896/g.10134 Transcript_4896/m.10134 type:complete len:214 (-) Transcript_4896:204-845(-)
MSMPNTSMRGAPKEMLRSRLEAPLTGMGLTSGVMRGPGREEEREEREELLRRLRDDGSCLKGMGAGACRAPGAKSSASSLKENSNWPPPSSSSPRKGSPWRSEVTEPTSTSPTLRKSKLRSPSSPRRSSMCWRPRRRVPESIISRRTEGSPSSMRFMRGCREGSSRMIRSLRAPLVSLSKLLSSHSTEALRSLLLMLPLRGRFILGGSKLPTP